VDNQPDRVVGDVRLCMSRPYGRAASREPAHAQ
jgi:hypothetical protein